MKRRFLVLGILVAAALVPAAARAGALGHGSNEDDSLFGACFPLGIDWISSSAPVDVFLEIAPVLDLLPGTDLSFNAAIGVRYWFR